MSSFMFVDNTSLRIDGGSSEMGRIYQDQQPSIKHGQNRAVRNALGGGLDIDTLPDNMTHVVVRNWMSYVQYNSCSGKV